jgi:PAS domain S-box-containing protein
MSWVTVIWSVSAGACLTLAFLQFIVWCKDRAARANLVFAVGAVAVAVFAGLELALMRAETPAQFGTVARWIHVPGWVLIVSIVAFVRLYLHAGRRWLAWTIVAVRTLALILNFVLSPNINYWKLTALRHMPFLGEPVSVPVGVPNPWMLVAQFSLLLLVIFVVDATITVWRRGNRRQALVVGGSIVLLVLLASTQAVAMTWGILATPLTVSLFYLILVAAMAYELSYDLIRAAQLTRQLQVSETELREAHQRMDLATSAAGLGLWVWDIVRDEIWVSEKERALFGFAPSEKPDIDRFRNAIHPDDRASMRKALENSLNTGMEYEAEHRVLLPNGQISWLATRGRVEFGGDGKPARMRGVSFDVTRRKLGEQALSESEERFRTMANTAPVMIWMSGTDKLCTFLNKRWLEFTGRAIEQEMGNGWAENVHPDDLQRCLKTYTEAFDAREPFVTQYRLRRHDGEYRWISDNGVPRYDSHNNFVGYIGSCIDITELLAKEEALHEFEERVALAAEAAHLGVWEYDMTAGRIWVSDKVRQLFQFPPDDEITYEEFQKRVHPDDRAARDRVMGRAIRSHSGYETEYRIVLPDGRIRWIGGRGRYLPETDGKSPRLLGVSMDITERKQAEKLFELATEASPSGTMLVDHQGQIMLVNAHIEQLFGYARDELIGKRIEILVPERFARAHPGDRAHFFAAPEARAMGAGRELFARRKDGSEFPVEIGLNPIQTPHGLVVLANVVDISARLATEEVTRRSREQVELLSRVSLLGEMTASLAHELNQPLAAIVNNATAAMQYLEQGRLNPEQLQDILTDVVGDGRRACDIMHNVRSAIKKGSAIRGRINLNDVVKAVSHMVRADAGAQSCKIELSLARDLPAIEGDPTQIQQVVINLLDNALDAMRDAPPSRRIVAIATNYNGDATISVVVRDYGSGISEATRERLFEQFFTTKDDGLGMGLAIVRSIVEAHGGSVAAENAEGGGARFQFRLPIKEGVSQ